MIANILSWLVMALCFVFALGLMAFSAGLLLGWWCFPYEREE